MKELKESCEKIIAYIELYNESKRREYNIGENVFYKVFGHENQRKEELDFQKSVSERIYNRINQLKKEQLIAFFKKKRDKHAMFSSKWAKYNNTIYKLENLKEDGITKS